MTHSSCESHCLGNSPYVFTYLMSTSHDSLAQVFLHFIQFLAMHTFRNAGNYGLGIIHPLQVIQIHHHFYILQHLLKMFYSCISTCICSYASFKCCTVEMFTATIIRKYFCELFQNGVSPIIAASVSGSGDVIPLLHSAGASVNSKDNVSQITFQKNISLKC